MNKTNVPDRRPQAYMAFTNAAGQSVRYDLPPDLARLVDHSYDDLKQRAPSSQPSFWDAFHSAIEVWCMDKDFDNNGLESIRMSSSDWRELLVEAIDIGLRDAAEVLSPYGGVAECLSPYSVALTLRYSAHRGLISMIDQKRLRIVPPGHTASLTRPS